MHSIRSRLQFCFVFFFFFSKIKGDAYVTIHNIFFAISLATESFDISRCCKEGAQVSLLQALHSPTVDAWRWRWNGTPCAGGSYLETHATIQEATRKMKTVAHMPPLHCNYHSLHFRHDVLDLLVLLVWLCLSLSSRGSVQCGSLCKAMIHHSHNCSVTICK